MNRTKKFGAISTILVAVLIFTAVFNVILTGTVHIGGGNITSEVAQATGSISKSDMNLDAVREQYLNYNKIEKNTASFDGQRWVIVELDGQSLYESFKDSVRFNDFSEYLKSVEGNKALASVKAKQSRFLDKLDKYGVDYIFKYNYTTLSNGVAIKVDAAGYNTIMGLSGVKDVYYSEHYDVPEYTAVSNNANVYSTGIYDTSELVSIDLDGDGEPDGTYQGQGMAVAILDTGLDHTHEAFDPVKFEEDLGEQKDDVHFTRDNIAELVGEKDQNGAPKLAAARNGAGVDELYYNLKVPFAYDYADDDSEVFPAYSNHGTHVAGIVAGKSDYDVTPENKDDDETFVGVAPLAQLVICKVFTDDLYDDTLGGADRIDILMALEDCVALGVDVINMSLGTSAGFSDEDSDEYTARVYNSIREIGISLVCAASNDYSSGYGGGNGTNLSTNPDSGTVGSPSTYFSALSVASINGQLSKYLQGNNNENQVAFITNSSDGDGNRIEFIEELRKQLAAKYGDASKDLRGGDVFTKGTSDDLNLKYVLIGGVGRPNNYNANIRNQLRSRTYNGASVDGTIALIKRGDTTFAEKVQEAMANGADAVIIYNNVSGTINMSLGEVTDPVPTCLITMDASVPFVDFAKAHSNIGTVQVSDSFQAGPFMSDFSSWGPVSDLTLKPEITAHGGEITSSVPGAYDVLSGTSMASPNMAGAVAVLRQYIKEKSKQDGNELTGNALNSRVNQVLMSTATIARNEEGNPYSPRKQGAGLAGIKDAVLSEGYITVKPNNEHAAQIYNEENPDTKDCIDEDGWLDKTKIELFDDPAREGVYTLKFTVWNITSVAQKYLPTTYVMTETLASDNKTVAEKAYMLTDMCDIVYTGSDNCYQNGIITVPANSSVNIEVKITLGEQARAYFEQKITRQIAGTDGRPVSTTVSPFQNGMYVEGFVSLDNVTNGESADAKGVTLGVPYLAFYGDWTDAPLFDYDIYEVSESEGNTAIEFEDKLKTTSLPTQVIGRYHEDDYILPLGTYLYEMDDDEDDIYPSREKIALSKYDQQGSYTVYELYAAYAGLLRNASKITTTVTNRKTGEEVYVEDLMNVGKAYAAGGGNRGAFVRYEINPSEWGWQNNDEFDFKIEGWLDYEKDGKPAQSTAKDDEPQTAWTEARNTFEFPLTIDYEGPQIVDYKIRFESYKENRQTKYRVYLDLSVYDNQYVMAVLPCYLKEEKEGETGTYLTLLTEYPVPVYGEKGSTTNVSIEITDYYEKYGLSGDLYVQVEDYAMNAEVYNISLDDDSLSYPENDAVSFVSQRNKFEQITEGSNSEDSTKYPVYDLNLNPFELYQINVPSALEKSNIFKNLHWKGANDRVVVNENEIFALESGDDVTLELVGTKSRWVAQNSEWEDYDVVYAKINVKVGNGKKGNMPSASSLNFRPVAVGDNHVVNLNGNVAIEVNPNQEVVLEPYISPWYFEAAYAHENGGEEFGYTWRESSSGNLATVEVGRGYNYDRDQFGDLTDVVIGEYPTGVVTPLKKGNVTVTCYPTDSKYSFLSKSVTMIIGEDFYVNNFYLYEYYGGPIVEVPSDLNVMYLDENCFKNDKTITEVVLPPMLQEIPNFAFQGCENLKKITIPSQCMVIGPYAFKGCDSLETVVFPEYVDANKDTVSNYYGSITVGHYAFAGCKNLKNFYTPKLDESGQQSVDEDGKPEYVWNSDRMTAMYDCAFAGCTGLEYIDISKLRIVGDSVFAGCENLQRVDMSSETAFGPNMFGGVYSIEEHRALHCTALTQFEFKGNRLPEYAFEGCSSLATFTFPDSGVLSIGERALAGTAISAIKLPSGTYTVGSEAFADCPNLSTVTVQAGTTLNFLGVNPFDGCTALTSYTVEGEGNAYVAGSDGALYNVQMDTLIALPAGKTSYEFPKGVTKIGPSAFSGSKIQSIDLTNIEEIGAYAFAYSALTTVAWPSGITKIPDGAFYGCDKLTQVNAMDVTEVGNGAFSLCTSLRSLSLPQMTKAGNYAFSFMSGTGLEPVQNRLSQIVAPALQEVGEGAFAGTSITRAEYEGVTSIGAWAFALNSDLTVVSMGAVTQMGDHAFYRCPGITSVKFKYGTTLIGDYAFGTFDPRYDNITVADIPFLEDDADILLAYVLQGYMNIEKSSVLKTVKLPETVTKIGSYAFTGQTGVLSMQLENVKTVGEGAFRLCTALSGLDLSKVETVGDYAFFGTGLVDVSLDEAKTIGAYAFAGGDENIYDRIFGMSIARTRKISGGNIRTLNIPKVEILGEYAFAGNKLVTVQIPATLNSRTYEYEEEILDDKGRLDRTRNRKGERYGAGAFAYNNSLTSITVQDGNDAFLSKDGVLYAKVGDQMVLVQYPGGKRAEGNVYFVERGTTSIGDGAFEGVNNTGINAVDLPYSIKEIGNAAFFGSSILTYTFNSVQAPTLVVSDDPYANELFKGLFVMIYESQAGHYPWAINPDDEEQEMYLDMEHIYVTAMYNNFNGYVFLNGYGNPYFSLGGTNYIDQLTFNVPKNGRGYDSPLYTEYATTINLSDENAADDNVYNALDAMDELKALCPDPADIANMSVEQIALDGDLANAVNAARAAYNSISGSDQLELSSVKEALSILLAYEKALRDARKGKIEVTLMSVTIVSYPTKLRYRVGETFDPTGMVIRALYSDGSEISLSADEIEIKDEDKKIRQGQQNVTVIYTDEYTGETKTQTFAINVSGSSVTPVGPDDPDGPETPEEGGAVKGGLPIWAIAVIAVGATLIVAAATVAVWLLVFKKKGKNGEGEKKTSKHKAKTPSESEGNKPEEQGETQSAPQEEISEEDGSETKQEEAEDKTTEEQHPQEKAEDDNAQPKESDSPKEDKEDLGGDGENEQ